MGNLTTNVLRTKSLETWSGRGLLREQQGQDPEEGLSHCSAEHKPSPSNLQKAGATNSILPSHGTATATSPSVLEPQRCLQVPSPNSSSSKSPQDKPRCPFRKSRLPKVSVPTPSSVHHACPPHAASRPQSKKDPKEPWWRMGCPDRPDLEDPLSWSFRKREHSKPCWKTLESQACLKEHGF